MTARVLIVDDNATNAKLLHARLSAEYYEVTVVADGPAALDVCQNGQCDIVLTDVVMPGMSGLELCRRIKDNRLTAHIPVVMVTRLDQPEDKIAGLEAGADDYLSEPTDTVSLITRIRSLMRLKTLTDALMARSVSASGDDIEAGVDASVTSGENGKILLVDDNSQSAEQVLHTLEVDHRVERETNPQDALFKVAEGDYDLTIVSLNLDGIDGLRLCSQLRSLDRTHLMPILVMVQSDDNARLMRALDIGVNDYLLMPVDRNEIKARVRTQIRRKRFTDQLRDNVQVTMEMAVTDGLTGLRNRRFLERQLAILLREATVRRKALSLMVLDIDHFKQINDSYGHPAGDAVLRDFARRVGSAVRGIDIAARIGGEEFVVVMPDTDEDLAVLIGERIRQKICERPFRLPDGDGELTVTVSIGVSAVVAKDETVDDLIGRADSALYEAKRAGRNRVVSAAA